VSHFPSATAELVVYCYISGCYMIVACLHAGATSAIQVASNGLDLAVENPSRKWMPSNLPVDIIDNYKEAVINFSKVCQSCNCCISND